MQKEATRPPQAVDKPHFVIPSLPTTVVDWNPMKNALQKGIPQSLTLNRNDISNFSDAQGGHSASFFDVMLLI